MQPQPLPATPSNGGGGGGATHAEGTAVPDRLLEPLTGTALVSSQVRGLLRRRYRSKVADGPFVICINGVLTPMILFGYLWMFFSWTSARDPVTDLALATYSGNIFVDPPALAAQLPGTRSSAALTAATVQNSGGFGLLVANGSATLWTATGVSPTADTAPAVHLQKAYFGAWDTQMTLSGGVLDSTGSDVAAWANMPQILGFATFGLLLLLQGLVISSTPVGESMVTSVGSSTVPALIAALLEITLTTLLYGAMLFVVMYMSLVPNKVMTLGGALVAVAGFVLSTTAVQGMMTATSGWATFAMGFLVFGLQFTADLLAGDMVGFKMPLAIFFPSAMIIYAVPPAVGGFSVTVPFPPAIVLVILLAQTVIYTLASEYFYQTVRRAVVKPWNYLWAPPPEPTAATAAAMEAAAAGNLGILIEDLRMEFDAEAAIDGLDLRVRRGETVAMLGHNGAGKTTTLSVLTGDLDATSYEACLVGGFDVKSDPDGIRRAVACATQADTVLAHNLSARENLELCAALRGVPEDRIEPLLRQLNLPLDADTKVSTFSGGMNRRLGVAMALVADSPVVLLDEPSAGLDPRSRRQLWTVLKAERSRGKTVLFTTHSMEEADALGDRIAIMSHGRMKFCDTSARLKSAHGIGYYLTVAQPDDDAARRATSNLLQDVAATATPNIAVDPQEVLRMCNGHCDGAAKLEDETSTDFKILLPMDALPRFGAMLGELEEHLARLGGGRYGVAINSLEEVYVEIAKREQEEEEEARIAKRKAKKLEAAAAAANGGTDGPAEAEEAERIDVSALSDDVRELRKNDAGADVEDLFEQSRHLAGWPLFRAQAAHLWEHQFHAWKSDGLVVPWVIQLLIVAGIFLIFAPLNGPPQDDSDATDTTVSLSGPIPVFIWRDPANPGTAPFDPQSDNLGASDACVDELLERAASAHGHWRGVHGKPEQKLRFVKSLLHQSADLNNGQWINTENVLGAFVYPIPTHLVVRTCQRLSGGSADIRYAWSPFKSARSAGQGLDWAMRRAALSMGGVAENPVSALGTGPASSAAAIRFEPAAVIVRATNAPRPDPTLGELAEVSFGEGCGIGGMLFAFFLMYAFMKGIATFSGSVLDQARMQGLSWQPNAVVSYVFPMVTSFVPVITMGMTPVARQIPHLRTACVASVNMLLIAPLLMSTLLVSIQAAPHVFEPLGMCATLLLLYIGFFVWLGSIGAPIIIGMGYQATGDCLPWVHTDIFFPVVLFWHIVGVAAIVLGSRRGASAGTANTVGLPDNADRDVMDEHERIMDPQSHDRQRTAFAALSLRKVFKAPCCLGPAWLCPRDSRNDEEDEEEMVERVNAGEDFDADAKYREDKVALSCVTIGVRRGECFGLLGPNGAGKTTLMSTLTRQSEPTQGETWIHGVDPTLDADGYYRAARIGTLSQGHIIVTQMSAVDNLRFNLRVRLGPLYGKDEDWTGYIHAALAKVKLDDVDEAEGKASQAFSGGMMRRLSVATALYTGGENIFLDEPSSAMDPYARRSLWSAIREASALRRSTLLTTHSMEEADAVCDRVAIVTKGDLRCIGTTGHLKQRFAAGYTIVLTLHQARPEADKILPAEDAAAPVYGGDARANPANVAVVSVAQQGVLPPQQQQPMYGQQPMYSQPQLQYGQQQQQPHPYQNNQPYPPQQQHAYPLPQQQQQYGQPMQQQQYPYPQQQPMYPPQPTQQYFPPPPPQQQQHPLHPPGFIGSPGPHNAAAPPPPPPMAGDGVLSPVAVPYFLPDDVPEETAETLAAATGPTHRAIAARHATFIDAQMGLAFGRSCVLKEEIGSQRRYTVTDLPSVAMAFQVLADRKEQWALENYTVSQLTTLEQVFLEFTQKSKALLA